MNSSTTATDGEGAGRKRLVVVVAVALVAACAVVLWLERSDDTVDIGVIGMAGGAVEVLQSFEDELDIRVVHLQAAQFEQDPLPDLSRFDAIITSFAATHLEEQYRQALHDGAARNADLRVFCVGPPPICWAWGDWIGEEHLVVDPQMAAYYGLSDESMREMLRYALVTYFGREGEVAPPGAGNPVVIYHPDYGPLDDLETFLDLASQDGWDVRAAPRVALGTWRHHVLYHQPQVVDALIRSLGERGMLAVCLVADDAAFQQRMRTFEPDLVIMTSHTQEPAAFWEQLGVPRIHALWFTQESIEQWRLSNQTGMNKTSVFHQIASAELKGATECLTSGGTTHGGDGGEEIQPIPDRIQRIVGRADAWIQLARKDNGDKQIAVVVYDRDVDKAGLLSGPAQNLNAPQSLMRFLGALEAAGYGVRGAPADEEELLRQLVDHGRQMGAWEPGSLDRMARTGQVVLVPEERYRAWFEHKVPVWRRAEVIDQWGPVPGEIMVWRDGDERYLVLPGLDLGNVRIVTQPLKGETITASAREQDPDESLLPPTHHYLATYFWLQEEFAADALVHFGSHGSEWLFPGKQAVLSSADWSDILIGDLPNINPWLSSNTSELPPCKRRAMAVTVGFQPPPLVEAGLPDDLRNLQATIDRYDTLDPGALRAQFGADVAAQVLSCGLDHDLGIEPGTDGLLADEEIERIALYLHDLDNELVPASMHVLGEVPDDDLLLPYLVHAMGDRYLEASRALSDLPAGVPGDRHLRERVADALDGMLRRGLSPTDAIEASGGRLPSGELPEAVREGLALAREMDAGFQRSSQEIDHVLAALDGRFVAPGPAGNPERNPAVVPTGRNAYVMNPEELPTRASWELGTALMRGYLEEHRAQTGRYPRKIGFSLVPFATYSDYGIIESQILYLMGVRPVWDAKNRVRDVELIPAAELGRPRIDVFLSVRSIYRDELPSLVVLLDRAVRLAASEEEADNYLYEDSVAAREALEAQGIDPSLALPLSRARIFGAEPTEILDTHNWFFYLTERTGEWESREDLLEVYLAHSKHVYTDEVWGEDAPEAFDEAIQGTEVIFRSWYDNRDFVLSNKFAWWVDGTLSLAVEHTTGVEPELQLVDVRDPDAASIVDSTEALQMDFRARLTNPRWIDGMMAEGYAGGNVVARDINNLMGWEITREDSVADSNWEDLTDVYVRDSRDLGVDTWFDETNPHAYQKVTVTMMETIRKGYWDADKGTRLEIVATYADSVARHGRASGVREGGNEKLEAFVVQTLAAAETDEMDALAELYRQRSEELAVPGGQRGKPDTKPVLGQRLASAPPRPEAETLTADRRLLALVVGLGFLIVAAGFFSHDVRRGRRR